jgi:RNA-directed DNA polymerase
VTEGIPFLGFTIYPQHRRLRRRKGLYFQRKQRAMMAAYRAGELELARVSASVQGWVNHVRHGKTVGLRKAASEGLH